MEQTNYNNGNTFLKIIVSLILVLFIVAFFKGCFDKRQEVIKIKIPEVKGSFAPVKPIHDTVFLTKHVKSKPLTSNDGFLQSEIDRLLKEYNSLDEAFANANDSLKQVIYRQTIQPKTFTHTFDNDTIKATVSGIVKGEVDRLKLDYIIKERTQSIKIPETVFRLLGGIEAGITKDLNKFNAKANIGFQNKKGSVLSIGIDTGQRIYVGYTIPIFSIKR